VPALRNVLPPVRVGGVNLTNFDEWLPLIMTLAFITPIIWLLFDMPPHRSRENDDTIDFVRLMMEHWRREQLAGREAERDSPTPEPAATPVADMKGPVDAWNEESEVEA